MLSRVLVSAVKDETCPVSNNCSEVMVVLEHYDAPERLVFSCGEAPGYSMVDTISSQHQTAQLKSPIAYFRRHLVMVRVSAI